MMSLLTNDLVFINSTRPASSKGAQALLSNKTPLELPVDRETEGAGQARLA